MNITAKYSNKSWEKQQFWKTDSGIEFCVEHNQCYGEFITSIRDKEGDWHACDGTKTMPERFKCFLIWEEIVNKSAEQKLIRPKFEKIYK